MRTAHLGSEEEDLLPGVGALWMGYPKVLLHVLHEFVLVFAFHDLATGAVQVQFHFNVLSRWLSLETNRCC